MGDEEPEYEVESIVEAKVEKVSKGKNSKLIWKYRVRWRGYSPADDTWEPLDSFNGSEHFVSGFWQRSSAGGRNVDDMTQFEAGETFHAVGPPKKKQKRKRTSLPEDETIEHGHSSMSQPPDNHAVMTDGPPPAKRLREEEEHQTTSTQHSLPVMNQVKQPLPSRIRRPPSPEVIPDSDEEMNGTAALKNYLSPRRQEKIALPSDNDSEAARVGSPDNVVEDEIFDPLFDEAARKPDHISRKENPLVQVVQTTVTPLQGAISAKARATHGLYHAPSSSQGPSTAVHRVKPGPGRSSSGLVMKQRSKSSLLTAEKGSLKTIKGKYKMEAVRTEERDSTTGNPSHFPMVEETSVMENETEDREVPSGGELLELAGVDQTVNDLPDFDEPEKEESKQLENSMTSADIPPSSTPKELNCNEEEPSSSKTSIEFPRHGLFSQFMPNTPSNVLGKLTSTWKQSTIFGPLSLGSDLVSKSQHSESSRILLNLDSSLSVPALLINPTSPDTGTLIPMMENRGTPGKFYGKEASLTLLGTLRAGGLSANIIVDGEATKEEKEHFKLFCARLQIGDIFVAMAGIHILVFCSSDNSLLSQRLNIPLALQNIGDSILVSRVDVENYSGYADAASNADERRWIQYVATVP